MMQTSKLSFRNILYLLFTLLGTSGAAGLALIFLSLAIVNQIMGEMPGQDSLIWAGLSFGFIASCGAPALVLAIRAFFRSNELRLPPISRAAFLILLLLPFPAGIAYLAYEQGWLTLALGPIGHILAASLPVLIVAVVVLHSRPRINARKALGQFLIGLWAMPPVIFILEMLALLPIGAILIVFASMTEAGGQILEFFSNPDTSPQGFETAIESIIFEPWLILVALGYMALLVPLIEEAIKTMAIWPWLRTVTPAQAFVSGALSGAGYGLFEAFFLVQPGQEWLLAMVGRAGATIMHAFTAGISCWGIAQWSANKRPWYTLLAYTVAVGLHGMWNASAILMGLAAYATSIGETERILGNAETASAIGAMIIIGLSILTMAGMPWVRQRLNQSERPANDPVNVWEERVKQELQRD